MSTLTSRHISVKWVIGAFCDEGKEVADQHVNDFDRKLQNTRGKLRPGTDEAAPEGTGEAADGRLRAVARRGRLRTLTLNPRLMRLPAAELAEHAVTAANAALDDLRSKAPSAEDAAADPAALAQAVRDVQDEGLRSMDMINQGIDAAMAQIRQRAQVGGDTGGSQGMELLLGQVRQALDSAGGRTEETETGGTGETADGQVRATALPGARVDTIELATRAMRMPSEELADHIVAAVNAALDDLRAPSPGLAAADPAELTERLRAVQDLSLNQMREYTRSLQNLMASIQKG